MCNKYIKLIMAVIFLGVLFYPLEESKSAEGLEKRFVRVAILKNVKSLIVSVRGVYKTEDSDNRLLDEGRVLRRSRVKNIRGVIHIGKKEYHVKKIKISSQKDMTVRIKHRDRRYRGELYIIANKDGTLTVINIIELEKYIRGVLYHEVSSRWPMEATKAQAVAARTYVLYQVILRKNFDYDVTSDIYSQVYGGRSAERYRTNIASKDTEGEVLTYQGKIFPAYYHSNCAGHTENAKELWNIDIVPLRGVKCEFDKDAPNSYWRVNFRSKDIQDEINKKGYKIGLIKDISVVERNESGRVRRMKIIDRNGKYIEMSVKDFRNIVGPNKIKSNKFDIIMKGYFFDVEGKGWGHGVGMCQWGANGMAKKKYKYRDILKYYYPQSKIMDYRNSKIKNL